jgi:hypothetical protein
MVQLAVGSAHADPAEDDASARLERGVAAYRARDFARAMNELLEANRLAPDWPDPYRWLALVEAEVDDCQSALINLETFVARVPAGDPRVPELVALRDRCLHTGKLGVDSTPSGAAIRIDGGPPVGTTPARLTVRTGPHRISLEKPGFEPQARGVDVGVGGLGHASFALTAAHDPPLTQRWWFWTALGAVAVTAIGLTYEATRSSGQDLPGVTCSAAGCHP